MEQKTILAKSRFTEKVPKSAFLLNSDGDAHFFVFSKMAFLICGLILIMIYAALGISNSSKNDPKVSNLSEMEFEPSKSKKAIK